MSFEDYESPVAERSAAERARLQSAIEADQRRAIDAARQLEAAEQAERARLAALDALRPLGERLIDARCTECHGMDVVAGQPRGPWGWRWTVERMHWLHDAALQAGEAKLIAEHLHSVYPAGNLRDAMERAGTVLLAASPLLGALVWRWHRRRARRHAA